MKISYISFGLIVAGIVLLLFGCLGKVEGPSKEFIYPIKIGNSWEYAYLYKSVNHQPDSIKNSLPSPGLIFMTSTVDIIGKDTLADSIETYVFYSIDDTNSQTSNSSRAYINNTDGGMYQYDNDGLGIVIPAKVGPGQYKYSLNGEEFNSIPELISYYRPAGNFAFSGMALSSNDTDNPIRQLAYPMTTGRRWTVLQMRLSSKIEKEIIGWTPIEANGKKYDCFVIAWFWDFDGDGQWDENLYGRDYISSSGLIKREFRYSNMRITDYTGAILGTHDVIESLVLTDIDLK